MTGALALSEHLAGFGILTTPLQWAGATPLAAYNVAFVLSFALSGFFAFLLVRHLLRRTRHAAVSDLAALAAGIAYGFGPYRAGQLAHLQVLTSQWMPLALLAMHAYVADGRRRWLALFVAAWLLQGLSNGYYLLFFPVLVGVWLLWAAALRRERRRPALIWATWVAASIPLVPMLLRYSAEQRRLGLTRTAGEMVNFSAKPLALLQSSGLLRFWGTTPTATTEEFLFPGLTTIGLVAAAWIACLRRHPEEDVTRAQLAFYTCAALLMWALAFGPAPPESFAWLRPYTLLGWFPGYGALRVPARFAMLATLCIAVAAGLAFARLVPRRPGASRAFAAAIL
ncbi:MAG TPA: hypothetical protein VM029_11880, partial [Opitutaceae bacterium]|nr:hypothetical protein [Opitutaceae bacterium]